MRIKLVFVLITLLIASAVRFTGCIEQDKFTKVSEIATSPASTPIILPTSTPTSDAIKLAGASYYTRKYSCQTCEGDSVFGENIACSACGGAGKCGVCGGDGAVIEESPCSLCGGTGTVNLKNPLISQEFQEFQADYFTGVKKVQKV